LKPDIFLHLFSQGCDLVIFLDPDIELYSDLRWVEDALADRSILLTPHFISTAAYLPGYGGTSPARRLSQFLRVGFYNTGFLAVRCDSVGKEFLAMLGEVLREQALRVYCYDQSWVGLLGSFFPANVAVCTHPGVNVAYWNLHERMLTRAPDGRYFVNEMPLKFMHFSKIERYDRKGDEGDEWRRTLALHGAYVPLFTHYRQELAASGFEERMKISYRYGIPHTSKVMERPIAAIVRGPLALAGR
jgi:hypothetical protein